MIQKHLHLRVADQEFVVAQYKASQEKVHVECASDNKMEVLKLAAVRLNHLLGEKSLDAAKQALVHLLRLTVALLHLYLPIHVIVLLLFLVLLLLYHFHFAIESQHILSQIRRRLLIGHLLHQLPFAVFLQ